MIDDNIDEKEITASFELGEWKSVLTSERRKQIEAYARNTLNKNKRVNIRISSKDLHDIQSRAFEEGIPYQTLMSSVLHKYVSGRLVEKSGV